MRVRLSHQPLEQRAGMGGIGLGVAVDFYTLLMPDGFEEHEVLLLGKDYDMYGEVHVASVGVSSAAAISVGADPDSPSNQFKHDPDVRNEDALSVVDLGDVVCLAVADAHYGPEASHMLVERLHREWSASRPRSPDHFAEMLWSLRLGEPALTESETTLVAAVYDRSTQTGFGLSIGDSSFVVISSTGGVKTLNERDMNFASTSDVRSLQRSHAFEFDAVQGDLLLAFTDGIDECNYRSPSTSIRPHHMATTAALAGFDPTHLARMLAELALEGVDGNPGGEDNIALVVSAA